MLYVIESSVGWSKEGPEVISTIPNAEGKKKMCFFFLNIDKPPGHLTLKIILNIFFYIIREIWMADKYQKDSKAA